MLNPFALNPTVVLPDRPFTHPEHSHADVAILQGLAAKLMAALNAPETWPSAQPPSIIETTASTGKHCRLVIVNTEALRNQSPISVVGFFGHKKNISAELASTMTQVDDDLIRAFPHHPEILCYCSQELDGGDWGNLVLLGSGEGSEHWKADPLHLHAVNELTPPYYAHIRLHNGTLPRGLKDGEEIILQRTKYYDFQGAEPWRAVREFAV